MLTTKERSQLQVMGEPSPAPAAVPVPLGSLYSILDELVELAALAEDPELTDEERLAVEQQIAKYVSAEIAGRKVDGIAATMRECKARALVASEEAFRLWARGKAWQNRAERIKDSTLRAMQAHSITKLETATNRLRIQGNGGMEPLDVYAPSELADELNRYRVDLKGSTWAQLLELALELTGEAKKAFMAVLLGASKEPDGEAIRGALKGRVVCLKCNGLLDVTKGCDGCGNTGTVPAAVAGARLLPRGVQLRVE